MKDETAGVAVIVGLKCKIVGLKPKNYSFSVEVNSEHKKPKAWIEMLLQQ